MNLLSSVDSKSSTRKPLLLRHFQLSFNELLLERVFYSPVVAPNVKFGFALCTVHHWRTTSLKQIIENFLEKVDCPLWRSADELAVIFSQAKDLRFQLEKHSDSSLQRLCALQMMTNDSEQTQLIQNKLLQNYSLRLAEVLNYLFSSMVNELSPIELAIYRICCHGEDLCSSLLCPMCNCSLTLSNKELLMCSCSNGHQWPRCSRTLLPLSFESVRNCAFCHRTFTLIESNEENYSHFLLYKDKQLTFFFSSLCTFCLWRLTRKNSLIHWHFRQQRNNFICRSVRVDKQNNWGRLKWQSINESAIEQIVRANDEEKSICMGDGLLVMCSDEKVSGSMLFFIVLLCKVALKWSEQDVVFLLWQFNCNFDADEKVLLFIDKLYSDTSAEKQMNIFMFV